MKKLIVLITAFILIGSSLAFAKDFNEGDIYWLTQNIYHEARGESKYGMLLVALVTLQRLEDGRWGDSVKQVVTAPHQFSWYSDGKSDIPKDSNAWKTSKEMANFAIMVHNSMIDHFDATHYHHISLTPYWSKEYTVVKVEGRHVFYKE